jgi:hypothetical protein
MNKKTLLIAMVVFSVMVMAAPVLAVPTQGQKLPISLKFTNSATTNPGTFNLNNGNIGQKRDSAGSYTVELSIDGADPIVGVSVTEVPISVYNMIKHQRFTIHEIHVMDFPTEDGGFEGNVLLRFTDVASLVPGAFDYHLEAHGTFQGTGAFEGQTIVASYDGPAYGTWAGYLLKP